MANISDDLQIMLNQIIRRIDALTANDEMIVAPLYGFDPPEALADMAAEVSASISDKVGADGHTFAVSIHTVIDRRKTDSTVMRNVLLVTRTDSAMSETDSGMSKSTMAAFLAKLEERSKHDFETMVSFNLDGVSTAQQFATTEGFAEVLGWLRGGTHLVSRDERGGLYMTY